MSMSLHTAWRGNDLMVMRQDREVDRIPANDIRRVILAYRGHGDSPGDLAFALFELAEETVILPAQSGIGGRVHFERQAFWTERNCIYWVALSKVSLPRQLRPGHWLLRRDRPGHVRLAHEQLAGLIDAWPLEGPQTWDQRKWQRIARSRALAPLVHLDEARAGR
ncbi:hypothetical protein BurJ1DRAFT_3125 [Burkholderiales bacterium JOSHI_001]|nr:hypothetical protein BurJ1DRAFT_3125 [Burkholderiales bacterium JOSHI_001]